MWFLILCRISSLILFAFSLPLQPASVGSNTVYTTLGDILPNDTNLNTPAPPPTPGASGIVNVTDLHVFTMVNATLITDLTTGQNLTSLTQVFYDPKSPTNVTSDESATSRRQKIRDHNLNVFKSRPSASSLSVRALGDNPIFEPLYAAGMSLIYTCGQNLARDIVENTLLAAIQSVSQAAIRFGTGAHVPTAGVFIPIMDSLTMTNYYVSVMPLRDGPGMTWGQIQLTLFNMRKVLYGWTFNVYHSWMVHVQILNGLEETSPAIGYATLQEGLPPLG